MRVVLKGVQNCLPAVTVYSSLWMAELEQILMWPYLNVNSERKAIAKLQCPSDFSFLAS